MSAPQRSTSGVSASGFISYSTFSSRHLQGLGWVRARLGRAMERRAQCWSSCFTIGTLFVVWGLRIALVADFASRVIVELWSPIVPVLLSRYSQRVLLPPAVQSAAALPTTCATNHLIAPRSTHIPLLPFHGRRRQAPSVAGARAPKVIKLVISRHPPGLESVVGGKSIGQSFQDLPAENRSSNFAEVHNLLVDCSAAFKQHLFPRAVRHLRPSVGSGCDAFRGRSFAARALLPLVVEQGSREHQAASDQGCSR